MFNILVVDDSGVIRLQVKQMLKGTNCRVFEAVNGQQVLNNTFSKECSLENVHLVLLDIYLGEIDGFEVLRMLSSRYPSLPVIMMSVERRKESILKCIELGAKDYLIKPFTKEVLLSRISRFCPITSLDAEANLQTMEETLWAEIDRAIRTKSSFTIYIIKCGKLRTISPETKGLIRQKLPQILRKIDGINYINDHIVLFLPVTNKEGWNVVKDKLAAVFAEHKIKLSQIPQETIFFPDDVEQQELISSFNSKQIKESFMQTIINATGAKKIS
ncbi:response regulator [Desulfurispora thermophila]|uniref:response regulator n=1 Tax=Desulfurispora thermophila TaxID=265470 RepID=UPI000369E40A|nr:response regulator [Desulfurispora thermophila]